MTLLLCYIFQNHPAWKKKNLHYFKMKKNLQLLFHNVPSLKNTLFFTKLTNVQVAPFKTFCWDIPKIIGLSIIYYFLQRVFPFSRYTNGTFHWRNGSVKIGIGTITQMRRAPNKYRSFLLSYYLTKASNQNRYVLPSRESCSIKAARAKCKISIPVSKKK